jgi:hypothetical protein
MTEAEAAARIAELEAENAAWRARCCRVALICQGGRPKTVKRGTLEQRALDLLDRAEKAERKLEQIAQLAPRGHEGAIVGLSCSCSVYRRIEEIALGRAPA